MNFKNLSSLTVIGLGLFLSTTSIKAAQASQLKGQNNESTSGTSSLISQLRGHDTYMGEPQIEWGDNVLGRVIAKSGDIMFITVEGGGTFTAGGTYCPGSDVLVGKNADGEYYLVDRAHSQWISILESKYGYKRLDGTSMALNERTAAIWAELNTARTTTTEIPPRAETAPATTYTPQPQVEQYNQPIRGLW
jgi:CobQ-like glutamine amidotransferase family enzyme